ncbi:MAG: carboxypeptidase regulatory-like domain-containing protein [Vicinamibacterales bacterium]|nr:carboxypeptidase regulatory-like domain-containing protein [Vicinamibacterales bacterium]
MRTKGLVAAALAVAALAGLRFASESLQAQGGTAISGVVSSQEEGKMEGVVVTARKDGGNSQVSVVTGKDGKYAFPGTHLEPGSYKLTTRAVGFDLTDPGAITVAAGKTAKADLKLGKTQNLGRQLSNVEWLMNVTNRTPEQKDRMVHQLLSCNYCHTYRRIFPTKYTADQWMPVIHRMAKYYADGTAISDDNKRGRAARIQEPGRVKMLEESPNWGASPAMPRTEVADFWAAVNLSSGRAAHPFELKQTLPRPKGAATKVIITEWDIPTAGTSTHDSALGKDGVLWFTDESAMYLGRFDTKTKAFKEYAPPAIPDVPKGIIPGTRDVVVGQDGMVWMPTRTPKSGSQLLRFDPKTEKYDWVEGVQAQFISMGPDGKIWAGFTRVDPKTLKSEGSFSPYASGVVPKGAAGYAGNTEIDSKGNPWMLTQIGPGGAMGYDVAAKKGIWWPVENAMGRRGAIDHEDNLWYGEYRGDSVVKVDTKTGKYQRWKLDPYSGPYTSSHPDKKGRVYAPSNMAERLYRIDPKTNAIIAYQWPTELDTKKINYQPGTEHTDKPILWFTNMRTARVSRVEVLE